MGICNAGLTMGHLSHLGACSFVIICCNSGDSPTLRGPAYQDLVDVFVTSRERNCPSVIEFFTGILRWAKMAMARAPHATGRLVTSIFFALITLLAADLREALWQDLPCVTSRVLCFSSGNLLRKRSSAQKLGLRKFPFRVIQPSLVRVGGWTMRVGRVRKRVIVTDSVPKTHLSHHSSLPYPPVLWPE